MMTRTFRVRGTVGSHPRFAKPGEKCLVGVPVINKNTDLSYITYGLTAHGVLGELCR